MQILESIGLFIQDQILGMKWLNQVIGNMLSACGLNIKDVIGKSLQFFLYDTIKIFILLSFLIFIISYIQSYFPPERTKKILGRFHGIWANILSALLGTVTPFCSCSSIPLFIGFTSAGLPVGVTFSFLISSPLVDLGSLILLASVFGFKIAIAYVIVGLILAVIGGTIIEKLGMEKYVENFIKGASRVDIESAELTKRDRMHYAWDQVKATVKKVAPYVVVGVLIGALIHNVIPEQWIQAVLGTENPFSPIIAAAIGIPMYADIFGTIPIAEALAAKGVGIGTILSFMMGVTALSLPSMIMLKKAVKAKLLAVFVGIVAVGIIIIGYFFNATQFLLI
ncbi:permease [Paludicola sp. MB14-C6]|uniref:permease n=1 Tax=Paludihabitans sp. MB14-C6 TaxID=3070656 RepID=UPI0027DD57C9|nr:permease [Paludicola sp. MB14-C6]WMJ22967.1 permease [Paludicola sp. MB14-C6]